MIMTIVIMSLIVVVHDTISIDTKLGAPRKPLSRAAGGDWGPGTSNTNNNNDNNNDKDNTNNDKDNTNN